MGIYASSGRSVGVDPLGLVALVASVVGAAASGLLWFARYGPSGLTGYSAQLNSGGVLHDQLLLVAFVAGAIGLGLGLISTISGRGRSATTLAIILGILALSYPVLDALSLIGRPLTSGLY